MVMPKMAVPLLAMAVTMNDRSRGPAGRFAATVTSPLCGSMVTPNADGVPANPAPKAMVRFGSLSTELSWCHCPSAES
jgi:hypothetical protein